ncbi:MAG: substrate-binding domain-containing protein [Acidobacteriota bacterium]
MKRNAAKVLLLIFGLSLLLMSVIPVTAGQVESSMILATTTSTQDSGLLDVLIPVFEKKYKTSVKVIAVGSGQAMTMGKSGDADVLLVHSRKAEDEFMSGGFGSLRKDVMHNAFLVVGPASDPAKVNGMTDVIAAFKKISEAKAKFISRGDKSGTDTKEKDIWKKAEIIPAKSWYVESGQGMGETLTMANEMNAYTLADEATYLSWKDKVDLKEVVKGDKLLANPYGVIVVNPEKFPKVHIIGAKAFADFVTNKEGQLIIYNFGRDKYGRSLFVPDAVPIEKLLEKPKPAPVVKPAPAFIPGIYAVANTKAKIYAGASLTSKVTAVVKSGTKVEVTGAQGVFYKIKYKGKTVFILKTAVKKAVVKK